MKKMGKKFNAALLALTMTVGSMTYPTKDAKAGVVIAAIGGLASDGTGAIVLPAGVAIAMMFGGVGLFSFSCYAFLDKIEVGDNKAAAKALTFLTLDAPNQANSNEDMLRRGFMKSYSDMNITVYQSQDLADLVIAKLNTIKAMPTQTTEIVFTRDELSPVLETMEIANPELAQKVISDLTQYSL